MGLTPAEVVPAEHIGAGDELKVIAETHRIALETARARLKSVFAKTNTHRQAELAVLLACLSRQGFCASAVNAKRCRRPSRVAPDATKRSDEDLVN